MSKNSNTNKKQHSFTFYKSMFKNFTDRICRLAGLSKMDSCCFIICTLFEYLVKNYKHYLNMFYMRDVFVIKLNFYLLVASWS